MTTLVRSSMYDDRQQNKVFKVAAWNCNKSIFISLKQKSCPDSGLHSDLVNRNFENKLYM